ncbi:LysR family transcriptional regulator [Luteimicrobium subarcticum]|uniref:DNA-binding transcriptional LysR family regulator n=1 Tax=Luteimicrobium subarcticum TaxID=620910 RepID=A0A2M8WS82_9MICO|nr:LysR family transcriptional regulator [Luteimicrobium subarcticum]PJI93807.1 DNA-binding transcriptional LysR family regulator [Luteimicrobium subarcticum]
MIDLGGVEALVAVARAGTVHGAAADLGYTASAVSQQVKRLERQLGTPLLERVGRGVVLTAAGRLLVEDGEDLLRRVERTSSRVRAAEPRGGAPTGQVRLAAFSTAVRGLVAPLVGTLRHDAPGLDVVVDEYDPWEAVARIGAGQADLAVVHAWAGITLQVPLHAAHEDLGHDTADLIVPSGHRLAGQERVAPGDLLDETWASTLPDSICYAWFVHMFGTQPRQPRIAYWAPEFASHVALVRAGAAVSLLPRLGRGALPDGVVAVPVVDPVPVRTVGLVWRSSMGESPAVTYLRARLRATWRTRTGPQGPAADG